MGPKPTSCLVTPIDKERLLGNSYFIEEREVRLKVLEEGDHVRNAGSENPGQWATLAIGILTASLSGLAILLHALGWVHLAFSVIVFAPTSLITFFCLGTRAKPHHRQVFMQRLAGGLFCGFMGLLAYDVVRWLILISGTVPFNPFRAIEVFGLLIMKADVDTSLTKTIGWVFHLWNGLAFAVMYTLAVGRGRLWWALAWSLMLETAMLSIYPSMFRIILDWPFVTISAIGHIAYGLALGLAARGAVRE